MRFVKMVKGSTIKRLQRIISSFILLNLYSMKEVARQMFNHELESQFRMG